MSSIARSIDKRQRFKMQDKRYWQPGKYRNLDTMFSTDFIRREIDAINEKWREIQKGSERKGEGLAIFYRLHIHPDLWRGIQEFLDTLSAEGREPFVFPEVEFLELTVNCDYSVEGWLILPIADVSPALRF